jgi:hypothetical protein
MRRLLVRTLWGWLCVALSWFSGLEPLMSFASAADGVAPSIELSGIRLERRDETGRWVAVHNDEVLWDDDQIRYLPIIRSDEEVVVETVRLLKRPWEKAQAPWQEVAKSKSGQPWVTAPLPSGGWTLSVEVRLSSGLLLAKVF